jgi:adenylate kinase
LTIGIVEERLSEKDTENGFLLDGFPRTLPQAKVLDEVLTKIGKKIDIVINIDVDFDTLLRRLSARRICTQCGTSYHLEFKPPRVEGVCDKCGGELYQRSDDNEASAKVRLETYTNETKPLIEYYEAKNILQVVNGLQNVEDVFKDIDNILGELK